MVLEYDRHKRGGAFKFLLIADPDTSGGGIFPSF